MKINVNGVEYDYEETEVDEIIGILREDGALKGFRDMRASSKEMREWIAEQKAAATAAKGTDNGGDSGSGDGSSGGDSGSDPAQSGDPTGNVGKGRTSMPSPPEPVSDEERQEAQPPKRKSRWWGDAISYDDDNKKGE